MIKKTKYLLIFLISIITVATFSSSKIYASLMISGETFETNNEMGDVVYFSLNPVMEKLNATKKENVKSKTLQYNISYKNENDSIVFDEKTNKITVNGSEIEDTYYKESNNIYVPVSIFNKMNTLDVVDSGLMDSFIVEPHEHKYNDLLSYNLGKDKYLLPNNIYDISNFEENNNQIEYNNIGSICVPKGKKLPLVIFLHGSYMGDGLSTYFDLGFAEYMKELANENFVSLGMNLTPLYYLDINGSDKDKLYQTQKDLFKKILEKHIKSLKDSVNNGRNNNYGFDMKDKIDFNNVILVGHSRGGQNLFLGYEILKDMGINVKGSVSIAPANYWTDLKDYPDIPTGIILPQLDGDVDTLDGRKIYDRMRLKKRNKDLQLIYLYSANHNNFNTTIWKADNSFIDDEGNVLKEVMSGKDQRSFASKYIVDFSKACINNNGNLSTLLPNNNGSLYNQKVLTSFVKGNSKILFNTTSEYDFKNISGNFKKIIASSDESKNTAGDIRLPGVSDYYPLALLKFKNLNDNVTINVSNNNDFSEFNTLSFEIMQDSTDSINKNKNQMLDITLTDKSGKSHTISTQKNNYSLQYRDGKMANIALRDQDVKKMYSNHTPLSTLMISLNEFNNKIDCSNVESIKISPSKSDKEGSFMLQSVYLSSIDKNKTIDKEKSSKSLQYKDVMYILIFSIIAFGGYIIYKKKIKPNKK